MEKDDGALYNWKPSDLLEVSLPATVNFKRTQLSLRRMGMVSNKGDKTLFPTCYIYHTKGRYYIAHFKEMYAVDGKYTTLNYGDIRRRNIIAKKLDEWELVTILDKSKVVDSAKWKSIYVLKKEIEPQWTIQDTYHFNIG